MEDLLAPFTHAKYLRVCPSSSLTSELKNTQAFCACLESAIFLTLQLFSKGELHLKSIHVREIFKGFLVKNRGLVNTCYCY